MLEKKLPGCSLWECELLLTAKKLYEASRSCPLTEGTGSRLGLEGVMG